MNFIRHINVLDNNFGRMELQNSISALLAESIYGTKETAQYNYNNVAPLFKAKIFLTNGETHCFEIGVSSIVQIDDYEYEVRIAVNGTNADKLQIMAKDGETVYVTIPLYTVDRIILIKQNIKIEEV